MKKIIFLVLLAFLGAQVSFGQTKETTKKKIDQTLTAKKVDKARGANPNIKSDVPTTDVPVAKSRGNCSIYFDNYTGYYIKIFVDGYYKGTLDALGGSWVTVGDGYTTIYCVTAGGTLEWTAKGNCEGEYHFKLKTDNAD